MSNFVLVTFETDQPDPPLEWFVEATDEQMAEVENLVLSVVEDWQNPFIGRATTMTFEAFMSEFREEWVHDDDD